MKKTCNAICLQKLMLVKNNENHSTESSEKERETSVDDDEMTRRLVPKDVTSCIRSVFVSRADIGLPVYPRPSVLGGKNKGQP